jgi:hypothetical protein
MPLFNSRGISTAAVLGLLTVVAVVFAVVGYMEWSSHAAWAEFMSATTSSASDQDRSNESATPVQSPNGLTGCPVGKRKPPTQLIPLP